MPANNREKSCLPIQLGRTQCLSVLPHFVCLPTTDATHGGTTAATHSKQACCCLTGGPQGNPSALDDSNGPQLDGLLGDTCFMARVNHRSDVLQVTHSSMHNNIPSSMQTLVLLQVAYIHTVCTLSQTACFHKLLTSSISLPFCLFASPPPLPEPHPPTL